MADSQANLPGPPAPAWDVLVQLDPPGHGPLNERLKRALRATIRSGRVGFGSTLPPSRVLAADLGCSRWAVTEAYEQLVAEGYLEARPGSGTRVRWAAEANAGPTRPAETPRLPRIDLAPGLPDLRAFPRARWAEAQRQAASTATLEDLGYPPHAGTRALVEVLGDYLQRSRAAAPERARLLVTTGTTSAVSRLCFALASDGHRSIGVEDPGWPQLAAAAEGAGLRPVSIGVDERGMDVAQLAATDVRAVITAPAHQFPAGVVLAAERRAALLSWAREVGGLVLEDDYDSEFRYDRAPVATLQGMDPRHVALLGSLSKTLSPALRLGWMLVPDRWADLLSRMEIAPPLPPTLDQLAFAHLLGTGGLERHLRRQRRAFRSRRNLLVAELAERLPHCSVSGASAGLHLMLQLPPGAEAAAVVRRLQGLGVRVADLDRYRRTGDGAPGLVLGYGNLTDAIVPQAVQQLVVALS